MTPYLKSIVFFSVFVFQASAVELILGKARAFPGGQTPIVSEESIDFLGVDLKVNLKVVDDVLIISTDEGIVLFSHHKGFVSTIHFSGEYGCFHIREGNVRASSSVGLLMIKLIEGELYSRLINIRKMKFDEIESSRVITVVGFKYPLIDIFAGVKQEGLEGDFRDAQLKLGKPDKDQRAETKVPATK